MTRRATIVSRDENNGRVIEMPAGDKISIRPLPKPMSARTPAEAANEAETITVPTFVYKFHPFYVDDRVVWLATPLDWSTYQLFDILVSRAKNI